MSAADERLEIIRNYLTMESTSTEFSDPWPIKPPYMNEGVWLERRLQHIHSRDAALIAARSALGSLLRGKE